MIAAVRAWLWYGPVGLVWMRAALAERDQTAARRYTRAGWPTSLLVLRTVRAIRRWADGLRAPRSELRSASMSDLWVPPSPEKDGAPWAFEIASGSAIAVLARGAGVEEATAVLAMTERLSIASQWAMPPGGGLGAQTLRAALRPCGARVRGAVLAGDAAVDRRDAAGIAAGGGFVIALGQVGPLAAAGALDAALRR